MLVVGTLLELPDPQLCLPCPAVITVTIGIIRYVASCSYVIRSGHLKSVDWSFKVRRLVFYSP